MRRHSYVGLRGRDAKDVSTDAEASDDDAPLGVLHQRVTTSGRRVQRKSGIKLVESVVIHHVFLIYYDIPTISNTQEQIEATVYQPFSIKNS